MEDTSKGEERESSEREKSGVNLSLTNPCFLFQEGFRALLKCLGLGDHSSSNTDHDPPTTQTTLDDPPSSTSAVGVVGAARKSNPRPPIKPGHPPQTNSIRSSVLESDSNPSS